MRLSEVKTHTIAWFKIADFVARGEKERALNVYKLLMHSINQPALSYQLEGDILLAFDDILFIDRYYRAANLYKKSGQIQQAISLYQSILALKNDANVLLALLDSYRKLFCYPPMIEIFAKLAKLYVSQNCEQELYDMTIAYQDVLPNAYRAKMYAVVVRNIVLYGAAQSEYVTEYINKAVDSFISCNQVIVGCQKDMQQFLIDLKSLDVSLYQYVQNCINHTISESKNGKN